MAALLALAAHANDAKWSHAEVVLSSDDAIEDPVSTTKPSMMMSDLSTRVNRN